MLIASLYPCPYDVQDRHEINAAVIKDGQLYACEEAKLTKTKNEGTTIFPERSLMMGLKELNAKPSDVDLWVFPTPKKKNLEALHLFFSWMFKAYDGSLDDFKAWHDEHVMYVPHQIEHAALGVFGSGFQKTAYFCQDGGGDLGDTRDFIFGEFQDGEFKNIVQHEGMKTICSFHAFVTDCIGFGGGDNGKTSGLAAYGKVIPELYDEFISLFTIKADGIEFDRQRFARTEVNIDKVRPDEYDRLKFVNQSPSETNIFRISAKYLRHDIAATGEKVVRDIFIKFLRTLREKTSFNKIVFNGGLFQNVALNNAILESKIFDEVYFSMAPSDSGLSLGAALYAENKVSKTERSEPISAYIGPSFSEKEIKNLLDQFRLNYEEVDDISEVAAEKIAAGKVVGWFQGKGEYGPRSLGARSILADPRKMNSKSRINQFLKKRDWFMPYAPSVLEDDLSEWTQNPEYSPYMQIALQIKSEEKAKQIPAAVHIDGSSRFHTVRKSENEPYWNLINAFKKKTGIGIVLNTSFNRHRIATISTPRHAVEHLMEGCMDYLAIGKFLVPLENNRLLADLKFSEKSEEICLLEDAINRLFVVLDRCPEVDAKHYISELASFTGVDLKYSNKESIFINGIQVNNTIANEQLIEMVNAQSGGFKEASSPSTEARV